MTAAGGNSDRPRNRKVAAVASIGFAYSAPTIVTWSHWSVPLTLGFSAVGGAPLIAGFTARAARVDVRPALSWLLFGCGLAGLLGALACLGLEWGWLREAGNALGPLAERIPCYPALTAAYGAAGLFAVRFGFYMTHMTVGIG